MQPHSEISVETAKALPTITVGGLTLFGVGLSDWVLLLTAIYTICQLYFLFRDKWYRKRKDDNGCD